MRVLQAAMRSLGFEVKNEELKKMLSDIDGDGIERHHRLRRVPRHDV